MTTLQKAWKRWIWPLLVCIALPVGVGALSAFLSGDEKTVYESLNQPPFAPPNWLFPIVWTVLLVLLGIASFLLLRENPDAKTRKGLMIVYFLNLGLIFLWPFLFFRLKALLLAFILAAILMVAALVQCVKFYEVKKTAGYLAIPYFLWSVFALFLSFGFYLLNR